MYAIIRTGGKQAKVREGDVLDVERLRVDDQVTFTPLAVVDSKGKVFTGRDRLASAKVVARVLGEHRGPKVDVFKYKPKTGYRRRQGHRQTYTTIEVIKIELPKSEMAAKKAEPKPKAEAQGEPKAEAKAIDSFEEWTKDRLYERAQQVGLEGRSQMTKGELIEALRKAEKEA